MLTGINALDNHDIMYSIVNVDTIFGKHSLQGTLLGMHQWVLYKNKKKHAIVNLSQVMNVK